MALTPWQMLIWIAGLELISIPLVVVTANSIISGYFKAKEMHFLKIIKALGEFLEKTGQDLIKHKENRDENND